MGCGSSTQTKVKPLNPTKGAIAGTSDKVVHKEEKVDSRIFEKETDSNNKNNAHLKIPADENTQNSPLPNVVYSDFESQDDKPSTSKISSNNSSNSIRKSSIPSVDSNENTTGITFTDNNNNTNNNNENVKVTEETEVEPFVPLDDNSNVNGERSSIKSRDNERTDTTEKDELLPPKPRTHILSISSEESIDQIEDSASIKEDSSKKIAETKLVRIHSKDDSADVNKLSIIHFNDVYDIQSRKQEPVGGATRFVTKVKSFPNEPLVLFSGDCLNPSIMSTVTKGKQMIPVMNAIGVNAAVYGNHDFDFGVDELVDFKNKTTFPWLMSNVKDKLTKTFLAEGVEKVIAHWHDRKIGIIGLVEKEWLVTLSAIDSDDVEYTDFIEKARELVTELRGAEGCDFVIALTHMRVPNDIKLLESDVKINLILGGHDHHYETKEHDGKWLVKSGTDFRELTEINIDFTTEIDGKPLITTKRHEVTSEIEEDTELADLCEKYSGILDEKMEETLGEMQVDLDGRFQTVRTEESNLGNFVCDIMRAAAQADVALLNSGSLRSDEIHPKGPFKMKDLCKILPMLDALVVLKIKGDVIVKALENSVSQYPKYEGRFLQVSGIKFVFDPDKEPGERILKESIMVHDSIPLMLDAEYTVVTKEYLSRGKDGYDMLPGCQVIVDAENGLILNTIIENHFSSIDIYKGRRVSRSGHRQSITVKHDEVQSFMEMERSQLAPIVEGRIRKVGEGEKVSPSYIRRKSKLRVRTDTSRSEVSMEKIEEGSPDAEIQAEEKNVVEEIEEDDSDIDSVMESDSSRETISDEERMNLWEACGVDDLDKMKDIINSRVLDFKFWIMEKTLLHHAAQHNSIKCLEYLLTETNLKVDVRDQILKGTALFYAAEHGAKEAANMLLDNRAKVNAKNSLWETALHVACESQQGDLIILLLSRGADRTTKNKDGVRPKI